MSRSTNGRSTNETNQMWREHREELRQQREQRRIGGTGELQTLRDAGYTVEVITEFQFRVNGTLDVFPTNRRYHLLIGNRRGGYGRETVLQLVSRLLREAK